MWPFNTQRISEEDLVDLHGKVVIITGGYSGIGYCTSQFLVRKGAKVYLATRNEQGTMEAIENLKKEGTGNGSLHWLKLDLDDPRAAKTAAEEFMEKENRLDILINNAGKAVAPFDMTKDGLRDSMVINYLSHFVLTETLLPLLIQTSKKEGSDVRIINLSSQAHFYVSPTSFVGRDNFNVAYGSSTMQGLHTYGLSKLACLHHIKHLQRRLNARDGDIICMAINPGSVMTPTIEKFLDTRSSFVKPIMRLFFALTMRPMREGAMNSAYVAASSAVRGRAEVFKGAYVDPIGKIASGTTFAREDRLGDELYETTLGILRDLGI